MSDAPEVADDEAPIIEAAAEAAPVEAAQDDGPSPEDRALAMGWTPKGQFRGDPDKWVDAETFIRRGEEFLPFLKANNKRLEQALERSEKKLGGLEKTLKEFAEHHTQTEARMYAKAKAELETKLDLAAQDMDVQGVRDATAELVALEKDAAKPAPKVETEDDAPEAPELATWKAANPWFDTDPVMQAATIALSKQVTAEEGLRSGPEFFAAVDRRLKAKFPERYKNPRRDEPGAVESGANTPRRTTGKTYSDLPPDARAACDDFVKRGVLTRERYIKDFFA